MTRASLLVLHDSEVKTVLAGAARCGGTTRDGGRRAGVGPRWGRKGKEEVGRWPAQGKRERRWRGGPAGVLAHGLYREQ
jgi:hypothetical protein